MGISTILIFMTFSALAVISFVHDEARTATMSRSKEEWTVDITGLFIQGVLIPAFPLLIVPLLYIFFPAYAGKIELNSGVQFLLSFVVVDYLYYWNHRFFHKKSLWSIHRLHHSSRHLDIFATSRNSLVTSFLFIYVWSQILALFLLKDASAFLIGLGLTFALDLWRHSGVRHPETVNKALNWIVIMPGQHVVHHSLTGRSKNFGANLCWWDKIHNTYSPAVIQNKNLERLSDKDIWRELMTPWKANK